MNLLPNCTKKTLSYILNFYSWRKSLNIFSSVDKLKKISCFEIYTTKKQKLISENFLLSFGKRQPMTYYGQKVFYR